MTKTLMSRVRPNQYNRMGLLLSQVRSSRYSWAFSLLGFLFMVSVIPLFVKSFYHLNLLVMIGIYTIIACGLTLLYGFAGQMSLAQAAFWGIGAYTSAVLTKNYGISFWFAIIAAGLVPGMFAYIIGRPILKLKYFYFAMGTLAFGEIMRVLFVQLRSITGGITGIPGIPPPAIGDWKIASVTEYYYLVWIITALVIFFSLNLTQSKIGRALKALNESEEAALCSGVDVARYKADIFALSAAFAGISGSLYGHSVGHVSSGLFGVSMSIFLIVVVAIGGLSSVWGALIGSVFLTVVGQFFINVPGLKDVELLAYGIVLTLVLMFFPRGLHGSIYDLILKTRK